MFKFRPTWPFANIGETLNFLALLIAIVGLFLVKAQLKQANDHQSWNNYNQLNLQYANLYDVMPEELEASHCKSFVQLNPKSKRWIRSYLNLYTEEHWLFENGLIPEEMWTQRIDGGVSVNIVSYPVIVEGYEYWKGLGSFTHPQAFIPLVDSKIQSLSSKLEKIHENCQARRRVKRRS